MADVQNIKLGVDNPDYLLFDNYYSPMANSGIYFTSIVEADNTSLTTNTDDGVWEINDDCDVEIVDSRTIKVNKFVIDRWFIRKKFPNTTDLLNWSNFKVNITGLSYLHNNIIMHTEGSDAVDGFTNAYCGTIGYNVAWYPGQFTSGYYAQGFLIQGGMCYNGSTNETKVSLHMGRAPWDIGSYSQIYDGDVSIKAYYGIGSRALTMGFFGGRQTATSWSDDSNGAYEIYDISDNPVYISLDVADLTGDIDVTSVECWDAYVGDTQVYHKDKTFENCWEQYGLTFPTTYNLTQTDLPSNAYTEWVSPTKLKVNSIPAGGFTMSIDSTSSSNYVNVDWAEINIVLSDNVPDGVTVTMSRKFTNCYNTYNESTGTWSDPTPDVDVVMSTGLNTLPAYTNELKKQSSDETMSYSEFTLTVYSDTLTSADFSLTFRVNYDNASVFNVSTELGWNLDNLIIPTITDLDDWAAKLRYYDCQPANSDEFWAPVKEWFEKNYVEQFSYLFYRSTIDEVTLNLDPNDTWMLFYRAFYQSSLKKIKFVKTGTEYNNKITSANGLFEECNSLKEIEIDVPDGHWLITANDLSNAFNDCAISTYPSNLINWTPYTNASTFSKNATLINGMFYNNSWGSQAITVIPQYGDDPDGEANTIVAGYCTNAFYRCSNLTTVYPILDLQLIDPADASNIFYECTSLSYIRIKNLNHGDWYFDGTGSHGTLEALNEECVKYLFENLKDLVGEYNPSVNTVTNSNSFTNWSSSYWESGIYQSEYDYKFNNAYTINAKRRYSTQSSAPFIVYTSASNISMNISVSGLQIEDGDSLLFCASGSSTPDYTITANGNYTITKTDSTSKGFKLIGNTSTEAVVTIYIPNGWDKSVPTVQSANLYCPSSWSSYITSSMITAANAKGWTIYVGNVKV